MSIAENINRLNEWKAEQKARQDEFKKTPAYARKMARDWRDKKELARELYEGSKEDLALALENNDLDAANHFFSRVMEHGRNVEAAAEHAAEWGFRADGDEITEVGRDRAVERAFYDPR